MLRPGEAWLAGLCGRKEEFAKCETRVYCARVCLACLRAGPGLLRGVVDKHSSGELATSEASLCETGRPTVHSSCSLQTDSGFGASFCRVSRFASRQVVLGGRQLAHFHTFGALLRTPSDRLKPAERSSIRSADRIRSYSASSGPTQPNSCYFNSAPAPEYRLQPDSVVVFPQFSHRLKANKPRSLIRYYFHKDRPTGTLKSIPRLASNSICVPLLPFLISSVPMPSPAASIKVQQANAVSVR